MKCVHDDIIIEMTWSENMNFESLYKSDTISMMSILGP